MPITDQESKLLDTALHWTWSCLRQIERLGESTLKEWSASEEPTIERRKRSSTTSYDEHLVLVSSRHLIKVLEMAKSSFPQLNTDVNQGAVIVHLRNMYEHWDEHQALSLSAEVPNSRARMTNRTREAVEGMNGKPWSISYGPEGPVLGGVISLREFVSDLELIEAELLKLETELRS